MRVTPEQLQAARDWHQCDEIEIDDDAKVSIAEGGYWVQAWVWVQAEWSEEEVLSICRELGLELGEDEVPQQPVNTQI